MRQDNNTNKAISEIAEKGIQIEKGYFSLSNSDICEIKEVCKDLQYYKGLKRRNKKMMHSTGYYLVEHLNAYKQKFNL